MENIGSLKDWQWMLLLQSVPIIPLGIATCFFLDKVPNAVQCKCTQKNNEYAKIFRKLLRVKT
jgi:hypothetical protein